MYTLKNTTVHGLNSITAILERDAKKYVNDGQCDRIVLLDKESG